MSRVVGVVTEGSKGWAWQWAWQMYSRCDFTAGPRSISFDGQYIFVTSSSLKHLLKLGSGKRGTIKGLVYANEAIPPGWVTCVDGVLVHKKLSSESGAFCSQIDRDTLKVSGTGVYRCVLVCRGLSGV